MPSGLPIHCQNTAGKTWAATQGQREEDSTVTSLSFSVLNIGFSLKSRNPI
jgi:hypothetical protein